MNTPFLLFLLAVAVVLFGPWEFGKKESREAAAHYEDTTGSLSSWRSALIAGLVFLALGAVALWFRAGLLWAHSSFLGAAGVVLAARGIWLRVAAKGR